KDALRVFIKVCAKLDFQNWIQISQTDLAKELNIDKYRISKAFKLLTEKGIVLSGPKAGRSFAYRLNPDYGWKGKVKNLNEYRQEQQDRENREFKNKHLRAVDNPIKPDESE
ncbi:helix-turn-helix domain-containing protein, partial [Chroococcus sp. FPU101]|uniref:MarR family transcriptional regulator n=1 Tax=Chroococcus sp. FPU101 TaxID=1974212 RepID=UPI001A8DA275